MGQELNYYNPPGAIVATVLFVGIALLPFYIFSSGQPQPSHYILAIFVSLAFLRWHLWGLVGSLGGRLSIMFLLWIVFRQTVYLSQYPAAGYITAGFFFFNAVLAAAIYGAVLFGGRSVVRLVYFSTLLAVALAVLSALYLGSSLKFGDGEVLRAVGSFNNPNQLGYFALCAVGILVLCWNIVGKSRIAFCAAIFACGYLCLLSLSKSAMVAFCIYSLCFISKYSLIQKSLLVGIICLVSIPLATIDTSHLKFVSRLSDIGSDSDDSLEARGYGLVAESLPQLLFGSGDGYAQTVLNHEVHSTFGSIIVSFGLLGLIIVAALYFRAMSRYFSKMGVIFTIGLLAPTLIYGVAHNGSRFFYILGISRIGRRDFEARDIGWGLRSTPCHWRW